MANKLELEEATCFHELLVDFANMDLRQQLLQSYYSSALSIGFGSALSLFFLHHQYNFTRLKGIDAASRENILPTINKVLENSMEFSSVFDFYRYVFNTPDSVKFQKITNEEKFDAVFDLSYEMYQSKFLATCEESFDVIISSNVLHYERSPFSVNAILSSMRRIFNPEGIFYIRVKESLQGQVWRMFEFESYEKMVKDHFIDVEYRVINHKSDKKEGRAQTFTNIGL